MQEPRELAFSISRNPVLYAAIYRTYDPLAGVRGGLGAAWMFDLAVIVLHAGMRRIKKQPTSVLLFIDEAGVITLAALESRLSGWRVECTIVTAGREAVHFFPIKNEPLGLQLSIPGHSEPSQLIPKYVTSDTRAIARMLL